MTISRLKKTGLLLVLALVACVGCRSTLLTSSPPVAEVTTLTLEAKALGSGEFALAGTTSLPEDTQLTAIALRHLVPQQATPGGEPLYSVLDYRPVTVANGQWSAQLNLWQVARDGRYQEAWQAQAAALNLATQPSDTVQFAIVLAPHHVGAAISNRAQAGPQSMAQVLRVTDTGDPFLWADQALNVGLPSGQTTPPTDLLARTNGGWGDRYLLVPEPPLPYTLTPIDERQTTAPLTPNELLR
ncbi:MAG: hypothetical protein WA939_00875 [Nodosilinea sp.]